MMPRLIVAGKRRASIFQRPIRAERGPSHRYHQPPTCWSIAVETSHSAPPSKTPPKVGLASNFWGVTHSTAFYFASSSMRLLIAYSSWIDVESLFPNLFEKTIRTTFPDESKGVGDLDVVLDERLKSKDACLSSLFPIIISF